MHRLDRRLTLLRGKRHGAFDPDQVYLERAWRTRVGRKVRVHLRRNEPVVLVAPRWSQARRFLDDVALDLTLGQPRIRCRALDLGPLQGRTTVQAWAWLVQAVTEFAAVRLEGPAWQAVNSKGFRHVMRQLMERADAGPRRCLMVHGLEHMPMVALQDLISVFDEHRRARTGPARFNLLLCGRVDSPHVEFPELERIVLPDFSDAEAVEALVEHLGPIERSLLEATVGVVGGVPALLDALGEQGVGALREVQRTPQALWRLIGQLATEIRGALEIVEADDALARRLEQLASSGPQAEQPELDHPLLRAGLTRRTPPREGARVAVRARFLAGG